MSDHQLPKRLFYGELQDGKRSQGGQKKCFKDNLKISVKAFTINPNTWKHTAQDRAEWHSSLCKGAAICEANRTAAAEKQRQDIKSRAGDPLTTHVAAIPCPHCQRFFQTQIGLFSHMRSDRSIQSFNSRMTVVFLTSSQWTNDNDVTTRSYIYLFSRIRVFL